MCLYIKDSLSSKVITPDVEPCHGVENIWATIQCRKLPSIIVGCIYRHPKAPAASYDYLSEVFKHVNLLKKPIYIYGDLNDNLLINDSKLKKIIDACKLLQLINKPTRITPLSATLLDVIITNKKESIVHYDCLLSTLADHDMIISNFNISKPKRPKVKKTFRTMATYDKDNFCEILLHSSQNLNNITLTDDVDDQVRILNTVFNSCLDQVAPVITKYTDRSPAPWINKEIKDNMKYRDSLQGKLKLNRQNIQLHNKYKEEKKRVKDMLQEAKKTYYHTKFLQSKGNSAQMWDNIRGIVPNNKSRNNVLTDDHVNDKAKESNNFFANVGRKTFEKCKNDLTNNNNG